MSRVKADVYCTVFTPFKDDGSLDEEALRAHLRRLVVAKTSFVLANGAVAEGQVMTNAELKRVLEIGVEVGQGKVHINAGLKECRSAAHVYELAKDAMAARVDVIQLYQLDNGHGMIPNLREQEAYWNELLSEIDCPVILNIHYSSAFRIPLTLLLQLCDRYRNIVGVHSLGGSDAEFLRTREALPPRIGVHVGAPEFVSRATLGADAYINPLNNVIPYVGRSMVDAWNVGDLDQVVAANLTMQRFLLIANQWAPSTARWVKMAMKVQGLGNGVIRLPYLLPPAEDLKRMSDQFAAMRLNELEAEARAYVERHA